MSWINPHSMKSVSKSRCPSVAAKVPVFTVCNRFRTCSALWRPKKFLKGKSGSSKKGCLLASGSGMLQSKSWASWRKALVSWRRVWRPIWMRLQPREASSPYSGRKSQPCLEAAGARRGPQRMPFWKGFEKWPARKRAGKGWVGDGRL